MRPTFMGFETATRGLMVNQKALDIVGNNTTNIGVTGYTRQRVDLVSLSLNQRYTRFSGNTTATAGQGANVYGVSQVRDKFLDKRFREEYSDVGYYGATSAILEDIAASLDEISPANMTSAMSKFQDVWTELLSKDITESTGAANVYAQANQIVQIFQQMSSKLDNVWAQHEYNLNLEVENINSIVERIALLNDQIAHSNFNSADPGNELYQPLELMDQRNVLLDQLAGYADITYEQQADGQVTVWMGQKDDSHPPVIQGDTFEKLHMQTKVFDDGNKTVSVFWNNTGKEVDFTTGSVRGMLDMLNGRGIGLSGEKGEVYSNGILYYKDKIDQFAITFADSFNNVIEIADPNTGVGYNPPQYKKLFEFGEKGQFSAATIKISAEWEQDTAFIVKNVADKIDGDSDNSYAAKVAQLFKQVHDFGEYSGTFNDYISFYSITRLSGDKSYADSRMTAVESISEDLLNQIQDTSGVSLEEEGVDMLMYKKAYDAVSRVFTTLDEMLDKLINSTGLVGR